MNAAFNIDKSYEGERLDATLADMRPGLSRANWQQLLARGDVLVDGTIKKATYKVRGGEVVTLEHVLNKDLEIDLPIVYEDDDVIVINKPPGLLVHSRSKLQDEATVVDLLRSKIDDDTEIRPGIVHRLDRDTSGIMVVARNKRTKVYLQKQFQNRTAKKSYIAVVNGEIKPKKSVIDIPIARSAKKGARFITSTTGKPAKTEVEVISYESEKDITTVRLRPLTGRTHQLRVHMTHIGHPICGDRFYGQAQKSESRLMLHAHTLAIAIRHDDYKEFEAVIPEGFPI